MQVLEPTYEFRLTIRDARQANQSTIQGYVGPNATVGVGSLAPDRRFYHSGKVGCDDALTAVRKALETAGIKADVHLEKFSHT